MGGAAGSWFVRVGPIVLWTLVAGGCPRRAATGDGGRAGEAPRSPAADATAGAADAPAAGPANLVDLACVANLDRYPGLTDDHRRRLERDGFFLAPTRATAPFQVYERNERLGLPGAVTLDLAVDVLAGLVASIQRDVEANFAAPALDEALQALVRRALDLRKLSLTDPPEILEALDRTTAIFATAGRLLEAEGARPEPGAPGAASEAGEADATAGRAPLLVPLPQLPDVALPPTVDGMVQEALARIRVAEGVHATKVLPREVDFGLFRTAERAPAGRMRALLRALLWLEISGPAAAGDVADPLTASLIVRLFADAGSAERTAAESWRRAARLLEFAGRKRIGVDPVDAAARFGALVSTAGDELPRSAGASLRAVAGAAAGPPRGTLGLAPGRLDGERWPGRDETDAWLGPAGLTPSAALALAAAMTSAPPSGPDVFLRVRSAAWADVVRSSGDGAARASVRAAVPLPEAPPGDCLPTAVPAARGIVLREAGAPLRAALAEAEGLAASLRSLGVLAARPIEVPQGVDEEVAYRIEQLVDSATQFLAALERAARFSAGGTPLSDEDAAALSRVGQWAESILADAAGAEAVAAADARWAVIDARGTVSGIGGVDALYVVIATPDGLLLARGAVRAFYRDLPWPQSAGPFTDEAWRMWLDSATPPPRPQELADVVAAPVPPPPLAGDGFRSCLGPDSGGDLEI